MRMLIFAFCLFSSLALSAQAKLSTDAQAFELKLKSYLNEETGELRELSNTFISRYDLYSRSGFYYLGAVVLTNSEFEQSSLAKLHIETGSQIGQILTLRVPIQNFTKLKYVRGIEYIEAGSEIAPNLDRSRYSLRADSVHQGLNLKMPYTGKGVIVAIIDWGFDYTHPNFYDSSGQNYRVVRAWDQNKNSGPHPAGFDFGTEYIGKDELLAAEQDTLYVFGPGSHGTHVGGIAGGSGAGTKYYGIAPDVELIFISLKRDDPSFLDAITYVSRYADAVGKPFVVNMSFGNHSGPHDGSTLRNRALDILAGKGKVFVGSAGNNGGEFFHLYHDFNTQDTLKTVVYFAIGLSGYWGETVNAWGEEGKQFDISLALVDNNDSILYQSPFYSTASNLAFYDTIYASGTDSLILRFTSDSKNLLNSKPNLLFEVKKAGFQKLVMIAKGEGKVHFWHIAQLDNRVTNWGQPFRDDYPGAIAGNPEYGIGGPPAISKEVITVASHRGEVVLPNGQVNLGQLSTYSSWGPTADERVKPDISGPGQDVASSVNSFDPGAGSPVETVSFNGKDYHFVRYSGTSMSGPAVAGTVALMLQANPNLTAKEVKAILKETARLDQYTGQIGTDGDLKWGWGKANAWEALQKIELKLSVRAALNTSARIYPNPSSTNLSIESEGISSYQLYDLNGKLVKESSFEKTDEVHIDLSNLKPGAYIFHWTDIQGAQVARVIKVN